jgi:AAA+ ATPase superfamily predicted ATPase
MNTLLHGRENEIKILENIWNSKEAEFVAIYGRRRVGKTFLIREVFSSKEIYFEIAGIKDGKQKEQLDNFIEGFSKTFYKGAPLEKPTTWRAAFELLTKEIEALPRSKKIVIFLDELPWLATRKSHLIQELDHFWNSRWSRLPNLKLIVCGSAASWILENLIHAKGGLHNRITKTILLEPFSLHETKIYLKKRGIHLNDKQLLDIYMVMGGVPHYLRQIQKGKSATQNINELCFHKDGLLYTEFKKLFKSLYDDSDTHLSIIREVAKHRYGIDRTQLLEKIKMQSGGTFNKRLSELEEAGFIQKFIPYGRKRKDYYYRIYDEYTLFYLTWIEPFSQKSAGQTKGIYWPSKSKTSAWYSWAGYAFEQICFKHVENIRIALGLDKIVCEIGNWRYTPPKGQDKAGAQIDLLLDRDDGVISIIEIKYSEGEFVIDKPTAKNLSNKIEVFENNMAKNKQIFLVMVTTVGLKKNMWSEDLVHNVVLLKDIIG